MTELTELDTPAADDFDRPRRRARRQMTSAVEDPTEEITLAEALQQKTCIIIAPRDLAERPGQLDAAKAAALGGNASQCAAPVIGQARPSRFRPDDLIVLAVPDANQPGNNSAIKLVGPIEVSRYWDNTAEGGAGSVEPGRFFGAIAKAAHPLFASRRDDNGTFELRFA